MKFFIGLIFGIMIGFPSGIYWTVQPEETALSGFIEFVAKVKGLWDE